MRDNSSCNEYFEIQYSAEMAVGTPPQYLHVLFDLMSPYSWVQKGPYMENASSSYRHGLSSKMVTLPAFGIQMYGYEATDIFQVGNMKTEAMTFVQTERQSEKLGFWWTFDNLNGIMGLGPQTLSRTPGDPMSKLSSSLLSSLHNNGAIPHPIFTVSLFEEGYGTLKFAGPDLDMHDSYECYPIVPSNKVFLGAPQYWSIALQHFDINTGSSSRTTYPIATSDNHPSGQYTVIFDMLTPFIEIPKSNFDRFISWLMHSYPHVSFIPFAPDVYRVPCDAPLPNITISFTGSDYGFSLAASQYLMRIPMYGTEEESCIFGFRNVERGRKWDFASPSDVYPDMRYLFRFGSVFFKAYSMSFDADRRCIAITNKTEHTCHHQYNHKHGAALVPPEESSHVIIV